MFLLVPKMLKSVDRFPCHVFSVTFLKSPCEHRRLSTPETRWGISGQGRGRAWGVGLLAMGGGASQTPCLSFPAQQHSGAPAPLWTPIGSDSGKASPSRWATAVHGVQAGLPPATTGALAWTT